MGQFEYQAIDHTGGRISGTLTAADRRSAVASLSEKGQFVTSIKSGSLKGESSPASSSRSQHFEAPSAKRLAVSASRSLSFGGGRILGKDVVALTAQLSAALQAGLPLMEGLQVIEKQTQKPALKSLINHLAQSVSVGSSLSEAMDEYPRVFSPLYRAMVRVGETGGILDQTMKQLAELLKRDEKVRSSIKTASIYPMIILAIGVISVIVIVTWILPTIMESLYESSGSLPLPTEILLGLSGFITSKGLFVLAGLVVPGVLFVRWKRTPEGVYAWDKFKLRVPIMGEVLRTIAVGRFTRTLGSLSHGGVTLLESLAVVRDTLDNEALAREVDTVAQKVKTGESLAEPLEESGLFPPLLVQIVSVGEHTGKLDELLLNAADTFDDEADAAITRFMTVLPSAFILILAVIVAFIIIATLLPILTMQLGA